MRSNPVKIFFGAILFFVVILVIMSAFFGAFGAFATGQTYLGFGLLVVAGILFAGIVTIGCIT